MIDREIVDFVIPAQRLREKERICQRLAGECAPSEVHEMRLVSSRKVRIPVIVAVSLIDHREDVPQGISGLILDISSSKALEAALAAERDRLKAILTNIGDAVVVTDPEGVIEYVNPAWENLNDYSFDEAQGMTHRLIRSGEQDDDFYDQMWRTLQEGKVWRGELVNRRKNGSLYDAALTITPVIGEAGKIINFVGVQHDISTLKEVDRLKSKFVSDVSHEFRTPLTNIRLYLDLLGQTEFDQRAARYLRTLSRESERISCLIEDLLSLSRLESGALPFSEQQVDVNAILRDLVEDRERLAAQKGISLRLVCRANLPMIVGDMQLLSQVFTNLLTNAMNYTLGGGTIEIWTRQHQGQREGWISIEVTDTGLGIPPEELPHIFDRFYRGKASELISAPGTGLGLSICKEIVERHAGQIHIDSEGIPGKGTQVTVWLPIGE
jgi:PAS domain S-box-containing protein